MRRNLRSRVWIGALVLVLIPIGFLTKAYEGPGELWVNNSLGGVLYVIFWSLLAFLIFPAAKPLRITSLVLIVTCILEVLQCWHPPFLESIRSTRMGVTLIGNSFAWLDFLHYFAGSLIAYLLISWISRRTVHTE